MIIRCDTDQIKKIRDDAFECAADLLEAQGNVYTDNLVRQIRAMKDTPVNVLVKGKG